MAPSAFDLEGFRQERRAEFEAVMARQEGGPQLPRLPQGENPDGFEVTLRELPARTVAYIRVLNPYQGTAVVDACTRLLAWADNRGLADNPWLGYMWEDPEIEKWSEKTEPINPPDLVYPLGRHENSNDQQMPYPQPRIQSACCA